LHDNTHLLEADSTYCETCGQEIKPLASYGYGKKNSNRIGIAISILLHVLAVLYYLFKPPEVRIVPLKESKEGEMVYIAPMANQAKEKPSAKPKEKTQPTKTAKSAPAPSHQPRVANTITPPRKQEVVVPPKESPVPAPPPPQDAPQDMQSMIAKRRAAREAANPTPEAPAEESEAERGNRIARANIMGAQGKTANGKDREDSGGVFEIVDKTYHGADIKFRGWNGNFKRTWSQQVHVERGNEIDVETAIVKRMIELIRQEKTGDFVWESHRLGRNVNMSARPADQAELEAFLLKEFFEGYKRGSSR
jgi:hypothetical protein